MIKLFLKKLEEKHEDIMDVFIYYKIKTPVILLEHHTHNECVK